MICALPISVKDSHGDAFLIKERRIHPISYATAVIAAFVIGAYDGFYGPGTGTFLIIAFTIFAKMNVRPIILIVLALLFTKMLLDF